MTDAKRPFLSIFMRWPGSLCWLLNALAVGLLCWWLGAIGGLAWYLLMPAFVALAFIDLFTTELVSQSLRHRGDRRCLACINL